MPKGIQGFQKGNKTKGFTGRKHSEETLIRMGKSHKGHPPTYTVSGEDNPSWKGGIRISGGYRFLLRKNHPFTSKQGYVPEHRLIVEKHIGRYLKPKEIVHHKNGKPSDNRIENLMVFHNYNSHRKYHWIEDGMLEGEIIFDGKSTLS